MPSREDLIARIAEGRSFIDVGGLWGVHGEKVSLAHEHGATELALLDAIAADDVAWELFRERMRERGIDGVECISADVLTATVRPFDVVHSSGVLYHLPSPMLYLARLRNLARRYLVLTTACFPEGGIENEHGTLRLPAAGALFVPALNENERRVVGAYWRGLIRPTVTGVDEPPAALGVERACEFRLDDYAPFWWLLTPPAIAAMCGICGFRILENIFSARYSSATLLLE